MPSTTKLSICTIVFEAWGEILSSRPRDSYVLATKVWGRMSEDPEDRGLSAAQILDEMPDLEVEDLQACLRFASRYLDHPVLVA